MYAGTESGADDIFPTNRFLTRALIDNSAGKWLRSSLITVPAERPVQATEGEVGAGGGYATAEDGATITVPAGAAEPGAEISAQVVAEPDEPAPPIWATDFHQLWDFEVEGGITEPVTLSLPLPQDGGAWSVVGYNGEAWELVPFVVEDGMIIATPDSLSLKGLVDFGKKAFSAVIDCGSDPLQCAEDIKDAIADCVTRPRNCAEVTVGQVSDLASEFWGAAKEGTRIVVDAVETGYAYVKRGGEWLVELGSQMVQTLTSAFNRLWGWTIQAVPPLNCEDESDNVLATLNPGQVLLESCAEDEGEGEHRLRIKNMRRFWVQACPGPLVSPDLRRAPNADVLGPLSNCERLGGTLLPSGREVEYISRLESPSEIRASFSDSAALMTMVDWILAIVGAADIEGKIGVAVNILAQLRELPAVSQLIDHAIAGRIGDVLSELRNILISPERLKQIADVIAKAAPSLGVEFGGSVIAAALAVVELGRVPIKLYDLYSAHYSESGTFAAAGFERTDRTQEDEGDDEPEPLPPIGDGSLFVLAGTSELYQAHVVDGTLFKRLILNPAVFAGYGFQLDDVRSVEQAEFDRWTTTDLARLGDDARVWRLFPDGGEGVRRWLDITPQQFEAAGFDWDAVISINQAEFDEWREGPPITAAELGLEDERDAAAQRGERAVAITVGGEHACALLDSGAVECWGSNFRGRADAPGGAFSAVSAGGGHTCGLRTNGALECWGYNGSGQTDAPGGAFSAVSAGGSHTCGLRTSGAVECWGDNRSGRADAPDGSFSAVSAGWYHTCGLRASGAIECWGANDFGQTDAPGGSFSAVSAGEYHTCGLRTNGAVECWGDNWRGQTDAPGGTFSAVSAGWRHTCGLRASGAVECWGENDDGQTDAPGGSFSAVSAGLSNRGAHTAHTCGLRASGAVECWGGNRYGQADVPGGSFSAVSASNYHTCGLRESSAIECWGTDWDGEVDAPGRVVQRRQRGRRLGRAHSVHLRAAHERRGRVLGRQLLRPGGRAGRVVQRRQRGVPTTSVGCARAARSSAGIRTTRRWTHRTGRSAPVSAGFRYTCGLRTSGAVECWGGQRPYGQTDAPDGAFSAVSAHTAPHLRSERVRRDRVLGRQLGIQPVRPSRRAGRVVQRCQRGQAAHLRAADQRRDRMLGLHVRRPGAAAGGRTHRDQFRGEPRLHAERRWDRRLLDDLQRRGRCPRLAARRGG